MKCVHDALKPRCLSNTTKMSSPAMLVVTTCVALMLLAAVLGVQTISHGVSGGITTVPTSAFLAHCPSHCGDVKISYPFGIGPGCFRQGFDLTCDQKSLGNVKKIYE